MNKRQLEAAKKVIDGDATGEFALITDWEGEVTYCALGGLGKAAGLTDAQLKREDQRHNDHDGEGLNYPLLKKRLRETFGINAEWFERISETNDHAYGIPARRRALKRLMDRIYAAGRKKAA